MYYNKLLKLNKNERVNIDSPIIRRFLYKFLVKREMKHQIGILLLNYKTEEEFSNKQEFRFLAVNKINSDGVYFPVSSIGGREIGFLDWLERHNLVEEFKIDCIEKTKIPRMHVGVKLNELEFVESKSEQEKLIEEAKRRYPIGSKVIPAHVNPDGGGYFIIREQNFKFLSDSLYAPTKIGLRWLSSQDPDFKYYGNTTFNRTLFNDGKWAKVVGHVDEDVPISSPSENSTTQPIGDSKPMEKLCIGTGSGKIGTINPEHNLEVKSDFKVGDKVAFRNELIDGKIYGRLKLYNSLRQAFIKTPIQIITSVVGGENFTVSGSSYFYSPEMLELVERPTSEKNYPLTPEECYQLKSLSDIPEARIEDMPKYLFAVDPFATEDEPDEKPTHPMLEEIKLKKIKY